MKGLKEAIGPGLFPNFDAIKKDSDYIEAEINGELEGFLWDFVDKKKKPMINFYKWAVTPEETLGVKLFYAGYALEKAGMLKEAIKAYYAMLVHTPKCISYTYWHTPLYMGRIALDRIKLLLRQNPGLGLKLVDAKITIAKCYDNDQANDKYTFVNPGKLIKVKPSDVIDKPVDLNDFKVIETRGGSHVSLKKYNNGHWQMFVNGKPFIIKGMAYSPNLIGKSPDYGSLVVNRDWQLIDENNNKINDVFFESYVDKNMNNQKDDDEPVVGDAKLMKEMGVNTLRLYHHGFNKELFRKLYKEYGISVLMGDFLGVYAIGSAADWNMGTDYSDPVQQENMINSVKEMVEEYKDEPYVLMWVLGNENNYGVANNAKDNPEAFYGFVQEVAKLIHKMDPTRPVALCNGDFLYLDILSTRCMEIDALAINSYRGKLGFGDSLWQAIAENAGKPVFISEYGCPAYGGVNMTQEEADAGQMEYHKGNWEDIWYNRAGMGFGNSLGGIIFEWTDEWWKAGTGADPNVHDIQPQFGAPFLDGWSYEEWFGICSQGDGSDSPYLRQLRKSYYYYKDVWNK
ncbi:MAG: glycoside hydrolase family 2 TIM barrel-domain containing protein [bacterium]|nr:glycoside hydrolase family 2 TIM barrel-domain containing protein [bacterium]